MKTTIIIQGTDCQACKALIEEVCLEQPGAKSCQVNFQTGETVIDHDQNFDWLAFQREVASLGKYSFNLPTNLLV